MTFDEFKAKTLIEIPSIEDEDLKHLWMGFCAAARKEGADVTKTDIGILDSTDVWKVVKLLFDALQQRRKERRK